MEVLGIPVEFIDLDTPEKKGRLIVLLYRLPLVILNPELMPFDDAIIPLVPTDVGPRDTFPREELKSPE